MESQLPVPQHSPEMGAYNPQKLPPTPEALPQFAATPERPAQQETQQAGPVQTAPALPMPAPPAPAQSGTVPVLNPVPIANSNPAVAGDDELIEKEWVDKAKKIVIQTKDDPYQQEKEVSKLQADYLKKRYGKEVKLASD
jgi:hypothetical protein